MIGTGIAAAEVEAVAIAVAEVVVASDKLIGREEKNDTVEILGKEVVVSVEI